MNFYPIAVFLHIVGALGFFIALGLEWKSLLQLRHATSIEIVRVWHRIASQSGRLGMPSMLVLLASGFYMMFTSWRGAAWILVSLAAIVIMAVITIALSGPRLAAIGRVLASEQGALSDSVRNTVNHPLLWVAMQARLGLALGIVFLMSVKPDLAGSLLAIVIALLLGLATAVPFLKREQARQEPATYI